MPSPTTCLSVIITLLIKTARNNNILNDTLGRCLYKNFLAFYLIVSEINKEAQRSGRFVKFRFLCLRCIRALNWVVQIGEWAESCPKGLCNHFLLHNIPMIYIIHVCITSWPGKHFRLKTELAYEFLVTWWSHNVLVFTVFSTTREPLQYFKKIQNCVI
jgi:hypothetical protein